MLRGILQRLTGFAPTRASMNSAYAIVISKQEKAKLERRGCQSPFDINFVSATSGGELRLKIVDMFGLPATGFDTNCEHYRDLRHPVIPAILEIIVHNGLKGVLMEGGGAPLAEYVETVAMTMAQAKAEGATPGMVRAIGFRLTMPVIHSALHFISWAARLGVVIDGIRVLKLHESGRGQLKLYVLEYLRRASDAKQLETITAKDFAAVSDVCVHMLKMIPGSALSFVEDYWPDFCPRQQVSYEEELAAELAYRQAFNKVHSVFHLCYDIQEARNLCYVCELSMPNEWRDTFVGRLAFFHDDPAKKWSILEITDDEGMPLPAWEGVRSLPDDHPFLIRGDEVMYGPLRGVLFEWIGGTPRLERPGWTRAARAAPRVRTARQEYVAAINRSHATAVEEGYRQPVSRRPEPPRCSRGLCAAHALSRRPSGTVCPLVPDLLEAAIDKYINPAVAPALTHLHPHPHYQIQTQPEQPVVALTPNPPSPHRENAAAWPPPESAYEGRWLPRGAALPSHPPPVPYGHMLPLEWSVEGFHVPIEIGAAGRVTKAIHLPGAWVAGQGVAGKWVWLPPEVAVAEGIGAGYG
ncbi:unnamed protein product [Vitrella brassicaformis CCMP3155]|uniref:Uncharacterized protein n=1 Tax=Vitrella brassicaformis (strain CCMP3155) TaxID=1169540 RepID=A0A0G4FZ50_VITBC|nr:unnamed protein product [Vitrella brassicaformis CCMP3155]|eukprot:CEM20879.1 unnamed protein product [Vitrella brassicaformis CCMP3155]